MRSEPMRDPRAVARARRRAALLLTMAVLLAACEREARRFREYPPTGDPQQKVVVSDLQPGPAVVNALLVNAYEDNAYALSQGKRLFSQMNCVGCHSHGGGNMGPALMDNQWIYGSEPEQIYASIAQGRPNGMPAWGRLLSPQQIWQLTGYVRSMAGLTPDKAAQPGRDDAMMARQSEQNTSRMSPKNSSTPPLSVTP